MRLPWQMALHIAMAHGRVLNLTTTANSTFAPPAHTSHTVITGQGSSFAHSCEMAISDWYKASADWRKTNIVTSYWTATKQDSAPAISATSLVTLCDGHPRAVGNATRLPQPILTVATSRLSYTGEYPTAKPSCSISPSDCTALWSSFNAPASSTRGVRTGPPCPTPAFSYSASSAAPVTGYGYTGTCTRAGGPYGYIRASMAQLLYWPVRTVSNSDYFCNSLYNIDLTNLSSPQTLTGTPTGSGPNTFVTGTLTITSPVSNKSKLRDSSKCSHFND